MKEKTGFVALDFDTEMKAFSDSAEREKLLNFREDGVAMITNQAISSPDETAHNAGYSRIGKGKVHGQLWIPEDYKNLSMLESFCGVETGLTEPVEVTVTLPVEDLLNTEELPAVTYALSAVSTKYAIMH